MNPALARVHVLAVRCDECGADPGEPCMTPKNTERPPHRARYRTADTLTTKGTHAP